MASLKLVKGEGHNHDALGPTVHVSFDGLEFKSSSCSICGSSEFERIHDIDSSDSELSPTLCR